MNRQDLQKLAEAYTNVHEGTMDIKGFEIPKKEQEAAAKRVKEKTAAKKKKNIRGNDSEEQKARLEKKRGMKLDDHPQFKKEEVSGIAAAYQAVYSEEEVEDIEEADSLAAMAARREKRLKAQRKKEGTSATGQDFGHDYGMPAAERKKKQKAEFDAFIGRGKKKTNEEVEAVDEGLTGARADRARQMQDSDTKSKGGKRTPADRDTAFRLGTGTAEKGTRKTGGRGGDEYGDRGKGNAAKRRMSEELEGNPVYEATKTDIKEFVGAMLGNAAKGVAKNVAMGAVNSAGKALATPTGAAIAGGTLGAATGGKKKVKKSLATGAGAAAGAALGGLPGAVIGGIAGNKLS